MANILFLAHRIPYPPNKGDKIRSWNFLSHLFEKHNVHLGFFVDDAKDMVHVPYLKNLTSSLCFKNVNPVFQKLKSLTGLLTGRALTTSAYPYARLRQYASGLIESGEIDLVFLFSAATGPIVGNGCNVPIVADLVDVDSQKWISYSRDAVWPLSWLYKREGKKLGEYERQLTEKAAFATLVSDQEAELFSSLVPELGAKIQAVPNGVDLALFNPFAYEDLVQGDVVLFTGAMDYQPNIDAVTWFASEIWPAIVARRESAVFRIAGGPAVAKVEALGDLPNVEVVGYVEDMAKEISKATVCVAPLRTARGIQNKVLEGMAMAKPVVATSLANEGINAETGVELLVADGEVAFSEAVLLLLECAEDRSSIANAARAFVEKNFTWNQAFQKLDELIGKSL